MKKSAQSLLLKIIGSLLILFVLFRLIDFSGEEFKAVINSINWGYFLVSLAGVILVLGIKSYRWQRIIRNEGHHYAVRRAFGAYMASFTIGVITPGRIGEIARLYYLRQDCDLPFLPAFRTIVTDRIFDLGVLVMLGMAALFHYSGWVGGNAYVAVAIGAGIFFLALFAGYFLLRLLLKTTRFNKVTFFQFVSDSIRPAVNRYAAWLWLITLAAYGVFYVAIDLIFLALGIEMRIVDIALVLSVVGLATILPVSWAGFGTREISLVYLLAFYGISAEAALSFSLLQFGAFFLWGSLIGLVFWLLMPISLDDVKADARALRQHLQRKPKQTG